ncbi:hypothetical protein FZ025_03565 [Xanthomonas hyacinthi]|uniref:hypothetical protein n=1 Tax=Xanthomonas hyacinthi TaxID=56455 RepID=UPI000AF7C9B7|nr:hypothetical protein [Xanthomonas hyacinthi]QGY75784.1 hypothetical protein FZ025_03565 [Xanthomonas hyacinthi]
MLKLSFGMTILLFALYSAPSKSDAANIRCDTCVVDDDFREQALVHGQGTHNIYNLLDNTIQTWKVPKQDAGTDPLKAGAGRVTIQAGSQPPVKVSTTSAAITELDRAHKVFVIGRYTLRPIINVPVGIVDVPSAQDKTATNFLSDQNLRAMLSSAIASNSVYSTVVGTNLATAIADLMAVAASPLGLKQQVNLIFRLVMTDGSSVDFNITLDSATGHYIEGSARTPAGQLVPDKIDQVQGEWTDAGGDDLNSLASYMGSLGATMQWSGSGHVTRIACVTAGEQRVCTVVTQ